MHFLWKKEKRLLVPRREAQHHLCLLHNPNSESAHCSSFTTNHLPSFVFKILMLSSCARTSVLSGKIALPKWLASCCTITSSSSGVAGKRLSTRTTTTTVGGTFNRTNLMPLGNPAGSLLGLPLQASGLTKFRQASFRFFSNASGGGSAKQSKRSFREWYEHNLETYPIPTKMVTGCVLWGLGDAVAQIVPPLVSDADKDSSPTSFQYDWMRTARASFFGCFLHAPTSHLHFNFLETMTRYFKFTGLQIPVFKTVMEQFVYWSWVSNSLYHGAMGAMQGLNPQQIYDRIADVLWDTQKAQWVFWIPVQLVNFQFVPVRHQLNVVLLISVVWTALLSAWYPPQEKLDSKEVSKDSVKLERKLSIRDASKQV